MLQSDLVRRIAGQNPHLALKDAEKIVNAILDAIVVGMTRGDRVEIRGFGVFSVRQRKARPGRNPRTGVAVQVEEKAVPHFKAGKELSERLNRQPTQGSPP
jgi:integration host factor subunit beta